MKSKGQSKKASWAEAFTNIAVGFGINYVANLVVLPFWGIHINPIDNLEIGLVYTVISVLRSFYLRRVYNWIMVKGLDTTKVKSLWTSFRGTLSKNLPSTMR